MSEQLISRRGAFSLLGLAAALGFAVPATMLTESDAEAQMQPTAPAPTAQPTPGMQHDMQHGMQQGQEQQTRQKKRREARRNARTKHRQARNAARMNRREARGKTDKLYMKGNTIKQQ
jgi:hypothetical protein